MLNIIVSVYDLGRSIRKVWSAEILEKVLKNSVNLYSKFHRNLDCVHAFVRVYLGTESIKSCLYFTTMCSLWKFFG